MKRELILLLAMLLVVPFSFSAATYGTNITGVENINGFMYVETTDTLQDKIDACSADSACGTIYLKQGNHTGGVSVPSGISLVGASERNTRIVCTGSGTCISMFTAGTRTYESEIRNVIIDGDDTSGSIGIDFTNHSNGMFQNVKITDFDTAIYGNGLNFYNSFITVDLSSSLNNVYIEGGTNGNNFFGGSWKDAGEENLHLEGVNQNQFFGIIFEGADQIINITESHSNTFSGIRSEMTGSSSIIINVTSDYNSFFGGRISGTTITDDSESSAWILPHEPYVLNTDKQGRIGLELSDSGSGQTEDTPGILINKSYSASGSPTGIVIDVARSGGKFLKFSRAGTESFNISTLDGDVWTAGSMTVDTGEDVCITDGSCLSGIASSITNNSVAILASLEVDENITITDTKDGTWTVGEAAAGLNFYSDDNSGAFPDISASVQPLVQNTLGSVWALGFYTNNNGDPALGLLLDEVGNITISGLTGSGNGYACLDSNGKLYRSGSACV